MFLIDILIYFVFALVMSNLARQSASLSLHTGENRWDKYLCWFIAFFTLMCAIRWNVGSDCISYARGFSQGIIREESTEYLWDFMVSTIYNSGAHWTIGMGLVAFIQMLFLIKATKNYSYILIALPFVLFGGRYFQDMMGAMRQMTVAYGFLWASKFIVNRQLVYYVLFVFISSFVHGSAVILLPFYFIPNNLHLENRRVVLIIILVACCVVGQTPAYQGLIGYIESLTEFVGYENYAENVDDLLENYSKEQLSFGPMMLSYLLIPIFIVWYGKELRDKYEEKIPYFNLWYNLAYFYACAYFLVCNVSHIFIRPVMYFSVFQLVMASLLLYELVSNYKIKRNIQLVTIIFCFVIFINAGWDIFKANNSPRFVANERFEMTTYKVYFMHPEQRRIFKM